MIEDVLKKGLFCACYEQIDWFYYLAENPDETGKRNFWRRSRAKCREINARYNYALAFLYAAAYREPFRDVWNACALLRRNAEDVADHSDGILEATEYEKERARDRLNNAYSIALEALADVPRLAVYPTEDEALDDAPTWANVYKFQRGSLYLVYVVDCDGVLTPDDNFSLIER